MNSDDYAGGASTYCSAKLYHIDCHLAAANFVSFTVTGHVDVRALPNCTNPTFILHCFGCWVKSHPLPPSMLNSIPVYYCLITSMLGDGLIRLSTLYRLRRT